MKHRWSHVRVQRLSARGKWRYSLQGVRWSHICEHGRDRSRCKEAVGLRWVETGCQRPHARTGGGSGLCEHRRQRSRCKDCGGSGIRQHGRERSKCKDCGGASICEHGRRRYFCKECGGSQICEHGRQRHQCKRVRWGLNLASTVASAISKEWWVWNLRARSSAL